jgi:hypothetical protein
LPEKYKLLDTHTVLKSACGTQLPVLGQLQDIEVKLNDKKVFMNPYVITDNNLGYAIIGVDTIRRNKGLIMGIINTAIKKGKMNG